jgi:hypothetical protein
MVSLIMTLVGASALAAEVPSDFSAGVFVHAPKNEPVVEMGLPREVYEKATHATLGDVRVFNAAGQAVPHGITALDPNRGETRLHRISAFAIDLPIEQPEGSVVVSVERDDRGIIRAVRAEGPGAAATRKAFILPVTGIDRPYRSVKLEWRRESKNFVHSVMLEGSNDLKHWETIESSWLIANLRRQSRTIRHNQLTVPALRWKFLRVQFASDTELPKIRTALLDVGKRSLSPQLSYETVELRADEAHAGRYEFDVPNGMHMRSMHIMAPVDNAYARVKLRSRKTPDEPWSKPRSSTVYRLGFDAGTIENKPLPVSGGPMPHWSVEVPEEGAAFDNQPPSVKIGWLAHTLVFVARGEGPYTLAYGSATAAPVVRDARTLLREMGLGGEPDAQGFSLPRATLGEAVVLGGGKALEIPPPPTDWKRYGLWAVLVAAVLLLLWMAVSLLREPAASEEESSEKDWV